jgi:hypothetical protein
MGLSVHDGDLMVAGRLIAGAFTPPNDSVPNAAIQAGAGVSASKLQHQHQPDWPFSDHATAPSASRRALHRVRGAAGEIVSFGVLATAAAGAASSVTVDLKKNGATVLTATITLDNTTAAFALKQPAGFTSTVLAAGDVLEAEITAVSGANPPKGVNAVLVVREDAQ